MYKYDDGAHFAGNGGVLSIVRPQPVGTHEGASDHDHYPEGFGDGERRPPDVS